MCVQLHDMAPGSEGVRPPKQERSRETLERILSAAEEVLDGRTFSEVSVEEILNRADVNKSSFYARFKTKEDLLPPLYERFTVRARDEFLAALALGVELEPRLVIAQCVSAYASFLRRFQPQTMTLEGAGQHAARDALQAEVTSGIVTLYLQAVGEPDNHRLGERVEFASRAAAAILLRAMGPPSAFAQRLGWDDDRLVQEVTTMTIAYLEFER